MHPALTLFIRFGGGAATLAYLFRPGVLKFLCGGAVCTASVVAFLHYTHWFHHNTVQAQMTQYRSSKIGTKKVALIDLLREEGTEEAKMKIEYFNRFWLSILLPFLRIATRNDTMSEYKSYNSVESGITLCAIGEHMEVFALHTFIETKCSKIFVMGLSSSESSLVKRVLDEVSTITPELIANKKMSLSDSRVDPTLIFREGVDVVLLNPRSLSSQTLHSLMSSINESPHVQCVISQNKLKESCTDKANLRLVDDPRVSANWGDDSQFFLYTKR